MISIEIVILSGNIVERLIVVSRIEDCDCSLVAVSRCGSAYIVNECGLGEIGDGPVIAVDFQFLAVPGLVYCAHGFHLEFR